MTLNLEDMTGDEAYQRMKWCDQLALLRAGSCFNHDPNAAEPLEFFYVVGDPSAPPESWVQGLSMFHNPRALVQAPEELFPGIAHHWLDTENRMRSVVPAFHPFGSFTQVLNGVPDSVAGPPLSKAYKQMLEGSPPLGDAGG